MRPTLSLGFALLTACVTPLDEGQLDQDIVGGQTTTTTDFPTVVGLQAGNGNWFCTGVLVDKDWVLTTASCFNGINGSVQVRVGDNNIADTGGGTVINVAERHDHPQFSTNSNMWSHDVSVLKLATSVTDRLPSVIHRDLMPLATSVTQVGYGYTNNNGGGGSIHSLTTTNVDCAQANDAGITNANLLCFNAADGNGSCVGDGGAPAFSGTNKEVVGIGSGGTGNSCTSGLDVYTAVAAELSFIDSFVPHTTTPPPPGGGSGSGSGSTPPGTDPPRGGSDDDPHAPRAHHSAGCSAGGNAGWLMIAGIAGLAALRRRRVR